MEKIDPRFEKNYNPKSVGDHSEAIVLAAFLRQKKTVLIPFGGQQPYDLVIQDENKFIRIQVKTGKLTNGVIIFNTVTSKGRSGKGLKSYRGICDYFAIYCPQTDKIYLMKVEDVPLGKGNLRVTKTKNNNSKLIRWAVDYEMPTVVIF